MYYVIKNSSPNTDVDTPLATPMLQLETPLNETAVRGDDDVWRSRRSQQNAGL